MPFYPEPTETEKDWMGRCMSHYMKEKGKPQEQAVAICMSVWRQKDKADTTFPALTEFSQFLKEIEETGTSKLLDGEQEELDSLLDRVLVELKMQAATDVVKADWDETKHPRADDGKFCKTKGGDGSLGDTVKKAVSSIDATDVAITVGMVGAAALATALTGGAAAPAVAAAAASAPIRAAAIAGTRAVVEAAIKKALPKVLPKVKEKLEAVANVVKDTVKWNAQMMAFDWAVGKAIEQIAEQAPEEKPKEKQKHDSWSSTSALPMRG